MAYSVRSAGGTFEGRYKDPQDGKIKSTRIKRATPGEAKADADRILTSLQKKDIRFFDPRWSVQEYAEAMLANKKGGPRRRTIKNYEADMRRLIFRYPIAAISMHALSFPDIYAWFKEIQSEFGPERQEKAVAVLTMILNEAKNMGFQGGESFGVLKKKLRPAVGQKAARRTLDREEFADLIAVPMPEAHRLFLESFAETGCRPQELFALKPERFLWKTNQLDIVEVVVWERKDGDEDSVTFDTIKNKIARKISVPPDFMLRMRAFITENNIKNGHVVFNRTVMGVPARGRRRVEDVDLSPEVIATLGLTDPLPSGKQYQHGTYNAYATAKCHCEYCTTAFRQYNRERMARVRSHQPRRNQSKTGRTAITSRPPQTNVTPPTWWKETMREYLVAAGIDWPTFVAYDFRHAHATWLAQLGVDPFALQARMGHLRITTTMGYINASQVKDNAVDLLHPRAAEPAAPADGTFTPAQLAQIRQLFDEQKPGT